VSVNEWIKLAGLPRGDVSSYRARASLWQSVAENLEAQAEGME
jgi:hypothetical protein